MTCCESAREALPLYFGGSLDKADTARLMAHLAVCADCRREAVFTLEVSRAARGLFPPESGAVTDNAFALLDENADKTVSAAEHTGKLLSDTAKTVRAVFSLTKSAVALAYKI